MGFDNKESKYFSKKKKKIKKILKKRMNLFQLLIKLFIM